MHPLVPTRLTDGDRGSRVRRRAWDLNLARPGDLVTVKTRTGSTWNFVLLSPDARGSRGASAFRGVGIQTDSQAWEEGDILPSQLATQRIFRLDEPIWLGIHLGSNTGPVAQVFHNRCLVLGDML